MSAQVEQWRVSTVEGVFETDLETLKQWIAEGCVLPTDKVSKGNLSWIDAGRAPMLKAAFNGEYVSPLASVPTRDKDVKAPDTFSATPAESFTASDAAPSPAASPLVSVTNAGAPANACYNHAEVDPRYICRMCGELFCKDCPRVVNNVPLCPLCGDLCKPYEEVKAKAASREFQSSGFGLEDFARAIRYPFQHKAALLCGAIMYAFLLLLGFRVGLIAYVIMFGCMSHVISQVAWGRLNRSFMPDFSAFSLWDDLVVPLFLGIGITIVTWGPVLVLIVALFFGVLSGGPRVSPLATGEPAPELSGPTQEDLALLTDPNGGDPKKVEEANRRLYQMRPGAEMSREAERSKKEQSDPTAGLRMLMPFRGAGVFLLLLFLVGLAWAIFYYPMALAVAGYTQSFGSVVNPVVGLDTIRRMGATYFKAFGMVLVIQLVALIVGLLVAFVTSPLALPFVGNLPAKFIDGIVTFYFNLVVACVLGLSLYKCADRLGISVD